MKVIRDHSAKMYKLMGSVPPRPSCIAPPGPAANAPGALGAWFAAPGGACVNDPQASLAWHALYGPDAEPGTDPASLGVPPASLERARALDQDGAQVFLTKAACCAPNTGAFTAGCTK
jgi:hypothetical protein